MCDDAERAERARRRIDALTTLAKRQRAEGEFRFAEATDYSRNIARHELAAIMAKVVTA